MDNDVYMNDRKEIPWNPVRELLHSVGMLAGPRLLVNTLKCGCVPPKSSPPPPSVVPEILSGPGLREAGSQVNL